MDSVPLHTSSRLRDLDFQIKCNISFIWEDEKIVGLIPEEHTYWQKKMYSLNGL